MAHTIKTFIEKVLINQIRRIQQEHNFHYLSFGLISQGIEFLGACLDEHPFDTNLRISRHRFATTILELFPPPYHSCASIPPASSPEYSLYKSLRCGFLHIMVPKSNLEVIQEKEKTTYNCSHLDIVEIRGNERFVLVSQEFFADFERACQEVIRRHDAGELHSTKTDIKILQTSFVQT